MFNRLNRSLTRTEPEPPWSFYTALGAMLAAFLTILIGTTIAQTLLGDTPTTLMTGWAIGMVLTISLVVITRRQSDDNLESLRLQATRSPLILWMLGALGVAISLDLLSWIIIGERTLAAAELLSFASDEIAFSGWLIAGAFMILLQPLGEELVFRGMIFPAARTNFGAWPGLLMSAAFYAIFHFAAYPPSPENQAVLLWYGLVLPFLDGLVFSSARAITGSTRASIVAHAAFGAFAVLKVFTIGG